MAHDLYAIGNCLGSHESRCESLVANLRVSQLILNQLSVAMCENDSIFNKAALGLTLQLVLVEEGELCNFTVVGANGSRCRGYIWSR